MRQLGAFGVFACQLLEQCLVHSRPAVNIHFFSLLVLCRQTLSQCVDPDVKFSPYTLIYTTHTHTHTHTHHLHKGSVNMVNLKEIWGNGWCLHYNTANSWNWRLDSLVLRGWWLGEQSYGLDFLTCSFLGLIRDLTSSLFILPSGLAAFPPAPLVNFSLCLLCKSDSFWITDVLIWPAHWLSASLGRESSGEIYFPSHVNYIMVPLRVP